MAYDMNVVNTAYSTAVSLGASEKVLLALFEAGIVESGFRNLDYGDSTSLGFLQQKPEYWGGKDAVMNVSTATTSFVTKAKQLENKYSSAGQLAQGVQRSGFPLKYDLVAIEAKSLLAKVSTGSTINKEPSALDWVTSPVESTKSIVKDFAQTTILKVFQPVSKLITGLGIYAGLVVLIIIALGIVYFQDQLKKAGKAGLTAGKAYVTGGASIAADAAKGGK